MVAWTGMESVEWWEVAGLCLYFESRTKIFAGVIDDSKLLVRTTGRLEWPVVDLKKTSGGASLDLGWRRLKLSVKHMKLEVPIRHH